MTTRYRAYTSQDLMKVRNYLSYCYSLLKQPSNWLIARWEFEIFFFNMKAGTLPQWESNIGLWETESGDIAACVLKDGDYYIQMHTESPEDGLLEDMLRFMERRAAEEGGKSCRIAIPKQWLHVEAAAQERGFELMEPLGDNVVSIPLNREFTVDLPEGFTLVSGDTVIDREKALGHIMAFDYPGTERAEDMLRYCGGLREAPDYHPELDLSILNQAGEVVSFCNIFVDKDNGIGILEPVGTHKNYRLQGLGRAVIAEGLNRLRAMGVTKAYTGPMQPFYERIGFQTELEFSIWHKTVG